VSDIVDFKARVAEMAEARKKAEEQAEAKKELPAQYFLDAAIHMVKPMVENKRMTDSRMAALFIILARYFSHRAGVSKAEEFDAVVRATDHDSQVWFDYFDKALSRRK